MFGGQLECLGVGVDYGICVGVLWVSGGHLECLGLVWIMGFVWAFCGLNGGQCGLGGSVWILCGWIIGSVWVCRIGVCV